MGGRLSRVWGSVVTRPIQRYAVEERAEKVITKFADPAAQPVRAPMFPSDADLLDKLRTAQPQISEAAHKKDDHHHTRLKDVFVTSEDPELEHEQVQNPDRPMPLDRKRHSENFIPAALRHKDGPIKPKRGKVVLSSAMDFLAKRKQLGSKYSEKEISEEYKISPEVSLNIVKYFSVYSMHEPAPKDEFEVMKDPLAAASDWTTVGPGGYRTDANKDLQEKRRNLTEKEIKNLREEEQKLATLKESTKKLSE